MTSRFAFARVVPFHDDGIDPSVREDVWFIAEWLDGENEPTKFNFCSLPPATAKSALIRVLKDRWRAERVYQDLKSELGFDHFERRSFPGWHHHVSLVHCCAARRRAGAAFPHPRRGAKSPTAPPRLIRTRSRPERHFPTSATSLRLLLGRATAASWLPRCPSCHQPPPTRGRPPPSRRPATRTTQ